MTTPENTQTEPVHDDGQVTVWHGDSLRLLTRLAPDSIDSVVTDPPYGLASFPDPTDVLRHWLAGDDYTSRGGGFMGASWDSHVPGPALWREVFRVLKPGGHAAVFAGTRTVDLMGLSLRLAGFEARDMISWNYGTGMAKSFSIPRALDRLGGRSAQEQAAELKSRREKAGLSREQVAEEVGCTPASVRDWEEGRARDAGGPLEYVVPSASYRDRLAALLGYSADERTVVCPTTARSGDGSVIGLGHTERVYGEDVTALAQTMRGWGTSLKPAHEPVLLVRKPLRGTVADTVLAFGTGGLNIDVSRITVTDQAYSANASGDRGHADNKTRKMDFSQGGGTAHEKSRFPANLVLSHGPYCTLVGVTKVKAVTGTAAGRMAGKDSTVYGGYTKGSEHAGKPTRFGDGSGTETVEDWNCPGVELVHVTVAVDGELVDTGWSGALQLLGALASIRLALAVADPVAVAAAPGGLRQPGPPGDCPAAVSPAAVSPALSLHTVVPVAAGPDDASAFVQQTAEHLACTALLCRPAAAVELWSWARAAGHQVEVRREQHVLCPVVEMDRQSGKLTSGSNNRKGASGADRDGNRGAAYGKESRPAGTEIPAYGDTGGASRFFKTLPFVYQGKAGSSDRPTVWVRGCGHGPDPAQPATPPDEAASGAPGRATSAESLGCLTSTRR